jgi:hypothetical protein
MASTERLNLPLMTGSQSQKHITHNEALQQLDDTVGLCYTEHGAATMLMAVEEEIPLSGATESTTIAFPNQCLILGASVRVTEAITGASSFDVGDGSNVDRFGGSLGTSLGSTNQGTIGGAGNYSSTNVVLTANGGNFTGGKVRVVLHYIRLRPATS